MLRAGIVGMPNVGKSTLFNAITKSNVVAENYPFATIDPNVGVVLVEDPRLEVLHELHKSSKIVPTAFEFIDIAGLVKGASKGEGLGNQFLSNIREVDAICQVVRCFLNDDIIHVEGEVNPIRDVETITMELALADLDIIDRRLPRIEKRVQLKEDDAILEYGALTKIKKSLEELNDPKTIDLTDQERKAIKNFNFLTLKPIIFLANIADDDITNLEGNKLYQDLKIYLDKYNHVLIPVSIKLESELASLSKEEQKEFLSEFGLERPTLDEIIIKTYELLGLKTFFTIGDKETRAWPFVGGMTAPECAGVIHTDFQRGFIRAETVGYNDLISAGNMQKAKELGKVRLEGKEYLPKDGDIMIFRFNV
ncbi:MAG TPA: redox-regulated ATPase YchF [Acholeplasmataceae bacterium]|nr:redox-regulated ATPase YchF [Acholeplasmataceae bacterium]